MQIKTFSDLIEWTRTLHADLSQCLAHCARRHTAERAAMLLDYLASHEAEMESMVAAFAQQADPKAARTYVYDYMPPNWMPVKSVLKFSTSTRRSSACTEPWLARQKFRRRKNLCNRCWIWRSRRRNAWCIR